MTEPGTGLALTGVTKHFGGLTALDNVDFSVRGGEIHALLGQNGSGKSTLVKIISGFHPPDPGARLELWGRPVDLPLRAAHEHGIAVIHQDLGLVEGMTVLENMGITSGYGAGLLGPISARRERRRCRELLTQMGLAIDPDTMVASLSPAARAGVAIARARRVLEEHSERFTFILDEPTVYLSVEESGRVMRLMRAVADDGSAVVFISHRLQEVMAIADRITVLRDGRVADTFQAREGNQRRIISAMLGRSLDQYYPDRLDGPAAQPVLRVTDLAGQRLAGVSFDAAPGEIIGFAGLVGMGHEEIPYLIGGVARATAGRAELGGVDLLPLRLRDRIERGVTLVPGNRQRDGAWPAATAQENITLPKINLGSAWHPLRPAAERREASALMRLFGVRPPEPKLKVAQFSGGNQQKIVLAKWMSTNPSVLLLDEPTQGIDAGAKFEILQRISEAAQGRAVVLIFSGDYEQLANVCSRVLVLRHGRVAAELAGDAITEPAIAQLAQGDTAEDRPAS